MKTPQNPDRTIPRRLVRGFLALVGVCVLYAASYGPAIGLSLRTGFPAGETVTSYYGPLWVIARKTSTHRILAAYNGWWISACRPKGGYKWERDGR